MNLRNEIENSDEIIEDAPDLEEACSPMITPGIPDTDEEFENRWKKFDLLSEKDKDVLCSQDLINALLSISKENGLSINQAYVVSFLTRLYFFKDISNEALIKKLIGYNFSPEKAYRIGNGLINSINKLKANPTNSQSRVTNINGQNILFTQALQQLPDLGEQLITSDRISLKNFPEPVRPSIKNWIADYTFSLGGFDAQHSTIARGNYLFHGDNTMHLSSDEREKLSYILKAYDENAEVTINKETKQIIFPEIRQQSSDKISNQSRNLNDQISKPVQKPAVSVSKDNINSIKFSSPQKLPYENTNPYVIKPVYPNEQKPEQPKTQPLPKNVVNLKE